MRIKVKKENIQIKAFLAQLSIEFLILTCVLSALGVTFGDSSHTGPQIFNYGSGFTFIEIYQLLTFSIISTGLRFVFLENWIIKRMSYITRMIYYMFSLLVLALIFAIIFQWIPTNSIGTWIIFLCCAILVAIFVIIVKIINYNKAKEYDKLLNSYRENKRSN